MCFPLSSSSLLPLVCIIAGKHCHDITKKHCRNQCSAATKSSLCSVKQSKQNVSSTIWAARALRVQQHGNLRNKKNKIGEYMMLTENQTFPRKWNKSHQETRILIPLNLNRTFPEILKLLGADKTHRFPIMHVFNIPPLS